MKTIIHVLGGLAVGGNERAALQLCTSMDPRRFQHVVVSLDSSQQGIRPLFDDAGIKVEEIPYVRGRGLAFSRRFRKVLRREGAGTVLSYTFSRPHLWVHYGARRAGVPQRVTRVSGWPTGPAALGSMRRLQRASRWVCGLEVANSHWLTEQLRHLGGFPSSRIHTIPNGVDLSTFGQPRRTSGVPIVLMVSRLEAAKDHLTLLDAFAELPTRARLQIVGEGPTRPALEARCRSLGISDRVDFTGARHDVPRLLSQATAFAFSTHTEGSPNALIEAMAAGLPCVATDIPPVREALGDAGLLVPPKDAHALARALHSVMGDPEAAAQIGRRCRERAEHAYDLRNTIHAYEALFAPRTA